MFFSLMWKTMGEPDRPQMTVWYNERRCDLRAT